LITVKVPDIGKATGSMSRFSSGLEYAVLRGMVRGAEEIKSEIESNIPELSNMMVFVSRSEMAVYIIPDITKYEEAYRVAVKEFTEGQVEFTMYRCPQNLYRSTAIRKVVGGSTKLNDTVDLTYTKIGDKILDSLWELIREVS